MDDAKDLREQAKQWRRLATRYTPGLAGALIQAAAVLDAQADRVEAGMRAPPAATDDAARPKRG
ncbi:MAG: hypothetical protein HY060_03375 [Proteobacteria bacterium]|nr:hypothetical protein [Pseudomonadota bacterium]